MGVSEAVEQAREAAAEWRLVRQMPKPKIRQVQAIETHLIQVRIAYDKRVFEQESEPAPAGSQPVPPEELDPWSISSRATQDGEAFEERIPAGEPYVGHCFLCKGKRTFGCDDCGGSGQKLYEEYDPILGTTRRYYVPCGTCAGAGKIECNACRASAMVVVSRFVRVETGTLLIEGIAHAGKLGAPLVQEIGGSGSAVPLSATSVAEATDVVPKGISPDVASVVRELLERDLGAEMRTYGRTVSISKGWVVQLELADRTLHVWGEPARVSGDDAPVAGNAMLLYVAGAVSAAVAVAALVYALM